MECAGDGCCGKCEDVGGEAIFEEFVFMFDTETLFFIDDDEAEVAEVDVFGEEAVGADEDIDLAEL